MINDKVIRYITFQPRSLPLCVCSPTHRAWQVLDECPTHGIGGTSDVAAAHITRRDGHYTGCCTVGTDDTIQGPGAKLDFIELQKMHGLERTLWLEKLDSSKGTPHPIALYGISTVDLPQTGIKSAFRVHEAATADPHRTWPVKGGKVANVTADCAFWLHLRSQVDDVGFNLGASNSSNECRAADTLYL